MATNRYKNWSGVAFASAPLTGVKTVAFDSGLQDLRESADVDMGVSLGGIIFYDPTFTVTTIDAMALQASLSGTYGVFTAVLEDWYNKATTGGGAKRFTTNANSYIASANSDGSHNQTATRQLSVRTVMPDGVTNPVSVVSV